MRVLFRHLSRSPGAAILLTVWVLMPAHARPSQAETVQVGFTAVIEWVDNPLAYLPAYIEVGDSLSGYYTYELGVPDLVPDPQSGRYEYTSLPNTMVVYADSGWVFRTDNSNVWVYLAVVDSLGWPGTGPADAYRFGSINNTAHSEEVGRSLPMSFMRVDLLDYSLDAVANDSLPSEPPDLQFWEDQRLLIITGQGLDWIIWAELVTTSSTLPTPVSDAPPRMRGRLGQNVPNPFNPSTAIPFTVGQPAHVTLVVYDVVGRPIRHLVHERLPAGDYETPWDGRDDAGRDVASGIYFYRLTVDGYSMARKAVLVK